MRSLNIRVTRDTFQADRTLGVVELDWSDDAEGFKAFGYSVEDLDRGDGAAKVAGSTAIPVGVYAVRLYDSPKHGPDTPELVNVPGFHHVQVHSGNGPRDTLGCILVGLGRANGEVTRSRVACTWLRQEIAEVIKAGGSVAIEVRRVHPVIARATNGGPVPA